MKQQGVVTCRADDLVKQCLLNMQRVLQSHGWRVLRVRRAYPAQYEAVLEVASSDAFPGLGPMSQWECQCAGPGAMHCLCSREGAAGAGKLCHTHFCTRNEAMNPLPADPAGVLSHAGQVIRAAAAVSATLHGIPGSLLP